MLHVTIDTTAPAAPGKPDLATASDSGGSNTDNITKVTSPAFTGTAEANSTVALFDGATAVGSGKSSAAGVWAITSATLGEGTHTIIMEKNRMQLFQVVQDFLDAPAPR